MRHRVVDTNVPLTAAGYNETATDDCRRNCLDFLESVFSGETLVVMDDAKEALSEYANKVPSEGRSSDLAGMFLIHLFSNLGNNSFVRTVSLAKTSAGQYLDYPDNEGQWRTDDPKCRVFDEDDKKWVAIARRFRRDTGMDAPIANAADRCWQVFERYLNSAGVRLEFLCNPHPTAS